MQRGSVGRRAGAGSLGGGPLSGRRLWRVGDWGSASEHIGRHWEEVGVELLADLLGRPQAQADAAPFVPTTILAIAGDRALASEVQAEGLAHADALLVGRCDGRLALQPVDFKWSLETADARQVEGSTLARLLEARLPRLRAALATVLNAEAGAPPPLCLDGLFFSPDHAENRRFLAGQGNRHDQYPPAPDQVVLRPVHGPSFFSPLPGWELAEILAALDHALPSLQTLEGAERYYRLGAGALGALTRLHTSIYAEAPAAIDGPAELAALRRAHRLFTSESVIAHLDRQLSARAERLKALEELERAAYPFAQFKADLAARGVDLDALPNRRAQQPWSRLYGEIQKAVRTQVRRDGRALVARGLSELEALSELRRRLPDYELRARREAARLLAQGG